MNADTRRQYQREVLMMTISLTVIVLVGEALAFWAGQHYVRESVDVRLHLVPVYKMQPNGTIVKTEKPVIEIRKGSCGSQYGYTEGLYEIGPRVLSTTSSLPIESISID